MDSGSQSSDERHQEDYFINKLKRDLTKANPKPNMTKQKGWDTKKILC